MLSVRMWCWVPGQPLGQRDARQRMGVVFRRRAVRVAPVDPVLDRGPGRQQDVVLVGAQQVGALLAQHADHL